MSYEIWERFSGRTFTDTEKAKLTELARLKECAETAKGEKYSHALDALKRFIDANPELCKSAEGLAMQLQGGLLLCGFIESGQTDTIAKECDLMREELGYSAAPAIERPLIDYVVVCWLRLMIWERKSTWAKTWAEEKLLSNRVDKLGRRYTRAIESLARVRKLTRATKPQAIEQPQFEGRRLEAVK